MTSPAPASTPPLDLDEVAALLAALRPAWAEQGLTAAPFTWRDARASWPQPLHHDRGNVTEPESVGLVLTAADGGTARLVIWRGGWADVDLLASGTLTTRNPDLADPAGCAALAASLASELAAPPARRETGLRPVTIEWTDDWWDGPVAGMATYQGRDCWFHAIFDTEADEWTNPRRCRLYELTPGERDRLWSGHREWEQHVGGNSCHHPGAPDPAMKPGAENFQPADPRPARTGQLIGEFTAPPLHPPGGYFPPDPDRTGEAS